MEIIRSKKTGLDEKEMVGTDDMPVCLPQRRCMKSLTRSPVRFLLPSEIRVTGILQAHVKQKLKFVAVRQNVLF